MSARIVVPPAPNWYSTNAVDCHRPSGVVAYAASKNLVFVWPTAKRNAGFPKTVVIHDAHRQKVTGVSWCQANEGPLLISSCSEDGRVCIRNAESQSIVLEQNSPQKLISITWSSADHNHVVCLSEDGTITLIELMLQYGTCSTRKIDCGGKINPTLVSFSPHTSWMLAVGCKGGLLYLIDTRRNRGVIHKRRAHEEDIHSVVWCPILKPGSEGLLATSSRDKMIKVWIPTEGKCLAQAKLPTSAGIYRPKFSSQENEKRPIWVALHWTNSDQILSSGLGGELLLWDVTLKNWSIVHKLHARGLFTISSYEQETTDMIWTSAQDRNLFLWPLERDKPAPKEVLGIPEIEDPWLSVPTLGGFVYCIGLNPIDSSHVALGLGDCTIRLWNTAAPKPDMAMLWNGIKGKVTSLSWHPSTEGRLAFGTDEGRVGVFDTLSPSKPPRLSRTYHKGTVYTLSWAPLASDQGPLSLYSCGGNHIFIHDPSNADADAVNFNSLIEGGPSKFPFRTELQWKPDHSMLAVGNEDGSVELYTPTGGKFTSIGVIAAHRKLIQCIRWHPQFTFQSADPSKYQNWLAIASNDTHIKVYDVTCNADSKMVSALVITLSGHKERVVKIAWSPHRDGLLLSASYDGTSQVWNVVDQKPMANFGGHCGRVLACDWNALEPDTAMTGGDDYTVRVWNTSDQVCKTPAETIAARPVREERKKAEIPTTAARPASGAGTASTTGSKKSSKLKSLFPVSSNLEARGRQQGLDDCKVLAALAGVQIQHYEASDGVPLSSEDIGAGQYANLGFFGNKASVDRMLKVEIDHHVTGSNLDLAAHLQLWRGSVENVLREAVKRKQLTDWLVSLAPQVSAEFWKEVCHCYGRQLVADGDFRKAVSYLTAAGFADEAIETLVNHQLYREAVALSYSTYPENDERIVQCLSQWAAKAMHDSNFELAAKCHLAIGQVAEAARALPRRALADSLRLAADLATHCQDDQLAAAYLTEAAEKSQAAAEQNGQSAHRDTPEEQQQVDY